MFWLNLINLCIHLLLRQNLSKNQIKTSTNCFAKQEYQQKVIAYAKAHKLPQSWIDCCSAESGGLDIWIATYTKSEAMQSYQPKIQPINIAENHEK